MLTEATTLTDVWIYADPPNIVAATAPPPTGVRAQGRRPGAPQGRIVASAPVNISDVMWFRDLVNQLLNQGSPMLRVHFPDDVGDTFPNDEKTVSDIKRIKNCIVGPDDVKNEPKTYTVHGQQITLDEPVGSPASCLEPGIYTLNSLMDIIRYAEHLGW